MAKWDEKKLDIIKERKKFLGLQTMLLGIPIQKNDANVCVYVWKCRNGAECGEKRWRCKYSRTHPSLPGNAVVSFSLFPSGLERFHVGQSSGRQDHATGSNIIANHQAIAQWIMGCGSQHELLRLCQYFYLEKVNNLFLTKYFWDLEALYLTVV